MFTKRIIQLVIGFLTCLVVCDISFAQPPFNLKSIVPLQSTRTDVEKLLGKPIEDGCNCNFEGANGSVRVEFAKSSCDGVVMGWNVPKDTVLTYSIRFRTPKTYDAVALNANVIDIYGHGVRKVIDLKVSTVYFYNNDNEIETVGVYPNSIYAGKRCTGFPQFSLPTLFYDQFASLKDPDLEDVSDEFFNLVRTAQSDRNRNPFIFVYRGKNVSKEEFQAYFKHAKSLVERYDETIVKFGGCRETNEIDMYFIPKTLPPPLGTPSLLCS